MRNELISVIVPVYNREQYIDKCVQSILNQTYTNLEVILVDDGSTDSSSEMCDKWQEKDSRVRVVHQKNGGLSNARNSGIKHSSGEYIAFVDVDDIVHPQMYEALYSLCEKYGLDMAVCKYIYTYDTDISFEKYDLSVIEKSAEVFTGAQALEGFYEYYQDRLRIPVWCKLYAAKKIKEIGFVEGKIHEDEFLIHQIVGCCDLIGITDTVLYYYYQSPDSIIRSGYSPKRFDLFLGLRDRFLYFKDRGLKHQAKNWGRKYIRKVLEEWHIVRTQHKEYAGEFREKCLKQLHEDKKLLTSSCELSPVIRLQLRWIYRYPDAVDKLRNTLISQFVIRLSNSIDYRVNKYRAKKYSRV